MLKSLRGLKKIKEFSFLTNAGRFVFALFFLVIFYCFASYKEEYIPVVAHTAGLLVLTIFSFFKVHSIIRSIEIKPTNFKVLDYVKDSFPLMLSSSLILLLGWTDTIFLGIYTSSKDVGIYHVALKLAALIGFSLQSMNSILAPKIAKAYKEEDKKHYDPDTQLAAIRTNRLRNVNQEIDCVAYKLIVVLSIHAARTQLLEALERRRYRTIIVRVMFKVSCLESLQLP